MSSVDDRMYLMAGADAEQLRKIAPDPDTRQRDARELEPFDPATELEKMGITLPEPLELTERVVEEDDVQGDDTVRIQTLTTLEDSGLLDEDADPYANNRAEYEASGSKEGMRFNKGKPRYDLLPPEGIDELVAIYTMGAEKYAPRNWEKGLSVMDCFGSLLRHAFAWARGETFDKESGRHHMGHVAWNAVAIATFWRRNMPDDRPVILD
jgi:hypothetical protein